MTENRQARDGSPKPSATPTPEVGPDQTLKTVPIRSGSAPSAKSPIPTAFFRNLERSRLFNAEQVETLRNQLGSMQFDDFGRLLVAEEWLTPYQLQRIKEGAPEGLVLGQYRVLDELGEGGFGRVYKAMHVMMNRLAALKVIAPHYVADPVVRELFLREVQATTRLTHPNIALSYDANMHEDTLYLAMEFVHGMNLETMVIRQGPIAHPFALALIQQIAQALQFAHERGCVHRDIKPANLMIPTPEGPDEIRLSGKAPVFVKIIDFGLARLYPRGSADSHSIRHDGCLVGTPEFMSPEQARDFHDVDIRSDLYSVGCSFYYAVSGVLPFSSENPLKTVILHTEREAAPIESLRPDIPPALAAIIRRLMAKKPEDRYASPAELAEEATLAIMRPFSSPSLSLPVSPRTPITRSSPPEGSPPPTAPPTETNVAASVSTGVSASVKTMLPKLVHDWLGVVEKAHDAERFISERDYVLLHTALMRVAEEFANLPADPRSAAVRRLLEFVEPWVTLKSLVSLDRESRRHLVNAGRQLEAELTDAKPRRGWLIAIALLLLFLAAAVATFALANPAAVRRLLHLQ